MLCITHLPQIACFADHHFLFSKQIISGRTLTKVSSLDQPARIEEIARMLGGGTLKEKARSYAQEMISKALSETGQI